MSFDKNRLLKILLIAGLIVLGSTTLAQTNDIEQLQKELKACLKSRTKVVEIAKDALSSCIRDAGASRLGYHAGAWEPEKSFLGPSFAELYSLLMSKMRRF